MCITTLGYTQVGITNSRHNNGTQDRSVWTSKKEGHGENEARSSLFIQKQNSAIAERGKVFIHKENK
jgi:hypothetical protein